MAAASTPKLHDIVECPICLETLTEPQMFGCFHFYCKKCVHDMKAVKQDETVGYECPLCRTFTAKGQLQALPIMNQLMEAFKEAKLDVLKCGRCKKTAPTQRCLDCKENYCDECRANHDEFKLFRTHSWKVIDDESKPIIDEIVFCQVHQTEQVKLHCRDCQQLICLLCKGTSHSQHSAEIVEEALQQLLPEVRKSQVKVKAKIKLTKREINKTKNKQQKSKEHFEEMNKDVTETFEDTIKKLKEKHDKLRQEIDTLAEEKNAKHEARVKQLELQLQSQENVLSLSQSTLDTAQNISLLKALQSGVLDSLNGSLKDADTLPEVEEDNVVFGKNPIVYEKLLGTVRTRTQQVNSASKWTTPTSNPKINFDELMEKKFKLLSQHNIGFSCFRFDVINDKLWCIERESNVIHIYSTQIKTPESVTLATLGTARSVISFQDKALVSATNGLFTVSASKPHDVMEVFERHFCDATIKGNQIFALEDNKKAIFVLEAMQTKTKYQYRRELPLHDYANCKLNTIETTTNHVFVSQFNSHVIQQYTLDGQLVREYGQWGSKLGELKFALLSGSDSFNNVLIAGFHNHRLDVLRKDGSFCTLPVTGIGSQPQCARIFNGKLYVVGQIKQILQVFTIA